MKIKSINQLDLFTEAPPPKQSYANGLLEQIRRDLETLQHPEWCHPDKEFYEERVRAYREEYQKVKSGR